MIAIDDATIDILGRLLTFIVESVNSVDTRALMVTSKDEKVLRVLDLVSQEQADRLEGLLASVNVIAKEEVIRLRRESTVFKKTQEVIVLAVNVA